MEHLQQYSTIYEKQEARMRNFYGNIANAKPEYLLRATPYTKETRYNFDKGLTKELFYEHLYTPRSENKEDAEENTAFDNKIDNALRDLNNPFAKVIMIHISGYAGCGKTTYIHHLIWEHSKEIKAYDVIDYEGHKKAEEPFVNRLAKLLCKYTLPELVEYFDLVISRNLFNVNRFIEYLPFLRIFQNRLKAMYDSDQSVINNRLMLESIYSDNLYQIEEESENNTENNKHESFLFFLLLLDFLLLLLARLKSTEPKVIVMVIDNSDSLSDLSEEMKLLPAMRDFMNECTFFFGDNLKNEARYHDNSVSNVCRNTKLVVFFTTRVVTKQHYTIIQPDWEEIIGLTSLSLPEHYYDQKEMILHRIKYYLDEEKDTDCQTIKELKQIQDITNVAYHNYNFMRLFNGNSRKCVERICSIMYNNTTETLKELVKLSDEKANNIYAVEGYNGYFLNLLLKDFKREGIYEAKLGLSRCRRDGKISLSRMLLTILREKGDRCSLLEVFQLLVPLGFTALDICKCAWSLCEEKRDFWRRLLIFDMIIPKSLESLNKQASKYGEGDRDIEHYSELVICTSGRAYMEYVIPHFEFMLSRHVTGLNAQTKAQYQPLFSENSEEQYFDDNGKKMYLFEKKIDIVYNDTKDCCYNSRQFSEKVMEVFHYDEDEFMQSSFFNYHTVGWDGEAGPKQSYESRLIFRQISYIEKYRKYLLRKLRSESTVKLNDINIRLVTRIARLLQLYQDSNECFQTEAQNVAAEELYKITERIRKTNYLDFHTRIELF